MGWWLMCWVEEGRRGGGVEICAKKGFVIFETANDIM